MISVEKFPWETLHRQIRAHLVPFTFGKTGGICFIFVVPNCLHPFPAREGTGIFLFSGDQGDQGKIPVYFFFSIRYNGIWKSA